MNKPLFQCLLTAALLVAGCSTGVVDDDELRSVPAESESESGDETCPPLALVIGTDDGGGDDECFVCDEESGLWVWDDDLCGEDDGDDDSGHDSGDDSCEESGGEESGGEESGGEESGDEPCDCDDYMYNVPGALDGEELCCVEVDGECLFVDIHADICDPIAPPVR